MTVLFSRKCEYALQGVVYLSQHRGEQPISADRIAADLNISIPFIAKTLQALVKQGFLNSTRGKHGGFSLAQNPEMISLLDIILAIDGPSIFETCVMGLPECGSDHPCPVHDVWGGLREDIRRMLSQSNIASFTETSVNSLTHTLKGIASHD